MESNPGYLLQSFLLKRQIKRLYKILYLWVGGGDPKFNQTRYPINDYVTGLRMVYVRLPMKITCDQCILQWSYVAGELNLQLAILQFRGCQ